MPEGTLFPEEPSFAPGTPLAERMRPKSLDEVVGQDEVVAVLKGFLARGELPSLVLWGPPGCGKTTIARLLSAHLNAQFVSFSAVLSGVKEAKTVMDEAKRLRQATGRKTVLFVDEVHRFNKAQQDAFLPFLETGDIVLVGATTENPSFELNRALLSRVKVYVLKPLSPEVMEGLLRKALTDRQRGLGSMELSVDARALARIVSLAAGDARVAYTLLELAAELAGPKGVVNPELVERVAQRRLALYDKEGEEHYNLISALHKSIRNSDPDAALYWLARMLEGGADPRFIARRLLRVASEDVGLADPRALEQAAAAALAVEHVGLPECDLALAQAAVYLALAPKSNALYAGYGKAREVVQQKEPYPVPLHLRNPVTPLMARLGYGQGYVYAHDTEEKVAAMECLPEELAGERFYQPSGEGFEQRIRERLADIARRKAKHGGTKNSGS
ncbi:ATPase AAA [Thermoanaerobaculum aquaticum]|uniref:Replication-associated recombination protein A n=1 Tax=Thermoanaerobaculum aquaticum TaxID=1312852 RepID=A0A062XZP8_9BACT|nr:replication-associated recombination protein A [Thermoanaerobaculum aquaticum]KDA53985.1 ATPase AAA [Thermoanaerobaculum aquaticum]